MRRENPTATIVEAAYKAAYAYPDLQIICPYCREGFLGLVLAVHVAEAHVGEETRMIDPKELKEVIKRKLDDTTEESDVLVDRETLLDCFSVAQYLIENFITRVAERNP